MTVVKENVRLLVDALRSGKYEQAQERLTIIDHPDHEDSTERDCCLGVACKIAIQNGIDLDTEILVEQYSGDDTRTIVKYDGRSDVLPPRVQKFFGFELSDPLLSNATASVMNDDQGADFDEIADLFETEYLTEPLPFEPYE